MTVTGTGDLGPAAKRLPWSFGSGPLVARIYGRAFAAVMLVAWLSLGVQVRVLIGSRGLLPAAHFVEAVQAQPSASFFDLPSLFRWGASDTALVAGVVAGAMLSLLAFAFAGVARRLCFALSTLLYLSYVAVGREFLSFQWDNLLLECGLLACFLPSDRPAPLVHFLFRFVAFKLYFESGIAKWQSPVHDWQDGSAMTAYYETAPLPTRLAFYAHHLPVWWHHLESRATLVLELLVPFCIFGPRRARLFAAVALTLFQILNVSTANYGFFCYLALALHLFLLDDGDLERLSAKLRGARGARAPGEPVAVTPPWQHPSARWVGRVAAGAYVAISLADAMLQFAEPGALVRLAGPALELNERLRLVNTYHLFAAITRERIEPEFQTLAAPAAADLTAVADDAFQPQYLRHKPGDVYRAPDLVAPHQPRVDFQLWFYGLRFDGRQPAYVSTLLERMCEAPPAVQSLFAFPLPPHPAAVRIVYWRYTFSSPAAKRATGAWWQRERIAATPTFACPAVH